MWSVYCVIENYFKSIFNFHFAKSIILPAHKIMSDSTGRGFAETQPSLLHTLENESRQTDYYQKSQHSISKGVLTPTLQPVCNWFATRKKLKSQSGCKGRGEVFFKSPTSR